jgi:hypothetical protein
MSVDLRERPDAPIRTEPARNQIALDLQLQWKQWLAFTSPATEILYGGAAFGGKSHLIRIAAINWCTEIAGLNVYIFRRVEDDLLKNHMEGPHSFRALLAPWVAAGLVKILETEIRFTFNGSRIFLCHCKDENHRFKYHGAEIHVLIIDELTTFSEVIYRYLRFRTRMVGVKKDEAGNYLPSFPLKYRTGEIGPDGEVNGWDLFPRVLCGSNPGNVGHHWVKREFIEPVPYMEIWQTPDDAGGMHRQYVPAKVADNPIGIAEDPDYVKRMRGLHDPALVKAMEEGDWNVVAGGYFPEFSTARHIVKPFEIPRTWRRFTSTDWGSARPFSTGWYAVVQDDMKVTGALGNPITIPRGALVRYREWYGAKPRETNVGLQLPIESWAKGVLMRSRNDPEIDYDVCDTSMFDEDGGPSLAERAMKVRHKDRKLRLRPADKRRLPGWNQLRQRLQGDDPLNGIDQPTLFLFDVCRDAIRTMEALQHDETDVEDADTDGEDHSPDEIRYACMSRPRKRPDPEERFPGPKQGTGEWLMTEAWKGRQIPGLSKRPLG